VKENQRFSTSDACVSAFLKVLISMEPYIRIETLEKELDQKNQHIQWLETQYAIIKSIIATIYAQRREEYWRD